MTSQKLLARSGWSPPWALPGALRDEADGVQGGCGEEISQLSVVPATTGIFGKERPSKGLLQIEPNTGSGQIKKMDLLLLRKSQIRKCSAGFYYLHYLQCLQNSSRQLCQTWFQAGLTINHFNRWGNTDVESLDSGPC